MQTTQPMTLKCFRKSHHRYRFCRYRFDIYGVTWTFHPVLGCQSITLTKATLLGLFYLLLSFSGVVMMLSCEGPKKTGAGFLSFHVISGYHGPGSPKTCYETSLDQSNLARAPTAQFPTLREFKLMSKGALLHIHMGFSFQLIDRGKHVLSLSSIQHVR